MLETHELRNSLANVKASIQTDVGCIREANEDSSRFINPNDPALQFNRGVLAIVADGMGGHSSGEIASQMAVEIISQTYYADSAETNAEALRKAIWQANHEIYQNSVSDENFFGMGTTVIALVLNHDSAIVAHVGDSRLYRLRDRQLQLLTIDHSEVMELVKRGVLTLEEARHHEDKNVILRAVGTQPNVEVEISQPFSIKANDEFLLCSDGLTDMISDEEIEWIWNESADIYSTSENLINLAKEKGGHDNITVGIVRVALSGETVSSGSVRVTREIGVLK